MSAKSLVSAGLLSAAILSAPVLSAGTAMAQSERFTVTATDIDDRKSVYATVQSVDVVPARARIGGTIDSLGVDEGSSVSAGEVIATVADPKLALEVTAIDARIESLKAQRDLARIDLERARSLRASGAGSQARLDEAQTNLDVVDRNIAAMGAERDVIVQRLEEGKILAPTAGRVLDVKVTEGTVILPGEVIATVAQESYVLRLNLPERHARFLKVGDRVVVGARGLGAAEGSGEEVEGRVRQVYPEIEAGRVVADVEVSGLGDYFVGERTRVHVSTGQRRTMVVPKDYLFSRYGLTFARLADGTETVVQTGLPQDGGVEVLSGLVPGDVLVRPQSAR